MQFLSCGLNKLAEQLSVDQFKHLKAVYPLHWKFLSKKGIYCYDCIDSMDRFDETSLLGCMINMYQGRSIRMLDACGRR